LAIDDDEDDDPLLVLLLISVILFRRLKCHRANERERADGDRTFENNGVDDDAAAGVDAVVSTRVRARSLFIGVIIDGVVAVVAPLLPRNFDAVDDGGIIDLAGVAIESELTTTGEKSNGDCVGGVSGATFVSP
jgi:hypothetical protein